MMALEHAGKGEDHPADTVEWLCGEPSCVPQLSESLREVRWKRGVLCFEGAKVPRRGRHGACPCMGWNVSR